MDGMRSYYSQQDGLCLDRTSIVSCSERHARRREAISSGYDLRLEADRYEAQVRVLSPTVAIAASTVDEVRGYYTNDLVRRSSFANLFAFVLENGEWKVHSMQNAYWPIEGGED